MGYKLILQRPWGLEKEMAKRQENLKNLMKDRNTTDQTTY